MSVLIENLSLETPIFRRSLRSALAIALAVFVAQTFNFIKGFWCPMTALIVMEATIGGTFRKGLHRVLGTLVGVFVDSLIFYINMNRYALILIFLISLFFAYYTKSYNVVNYGFYAFTMTVMILLLYQILLPQPQDYFIPRVYETIIGAAIGMIVTMLILPTRTITLRNKTLQDLLRRYKNFYEYQFYYLIQRKNNYCILQEAKTEILGLLLINRELLRMLRYETFINKRNRRLSANLVFLFERVDHLALSIEIIVEKFLMIHLPEALFPSLSAVTTAIVQAFDVLMTDVRIGKSDRVAVSRETVNQLRDLIKQIDQLALGNTPEGNWLNCFVCDMKDLIKILRKMEEYILRQPNMSIL